MLEVLFEADGLPSVDLPAELERLHGGTLGFAAPRLYANFVSTLDGVVAIPSVPESNKIIAAGSEADRFLMGLLRAFADVVVIGTGTLHGSPKGMWSPAGPYPATAEALAELRTRLGLSACARSRDPDPQRVTRRRPPRARARRARRHHR